MQIFTIAPDVERYNRLIDDESEQISETRFMELSFYGAPKSANWNPPKLRWLVEADLMRPERKASVKNLILPDIAYYDSGCLVLSPKATSILEPLFKTEAEFLPVTVEGENGWAILNIVNLQDVLDKANCRYNILSDGTIGRMIGIALFQDKLTNSKLFRVSGKKVQMFTSDEHKSFKEIVESNGLTGLLFDEC